jgi:hypothetical protein
MLEYNFVLPTGCVETKPTALRVVASAGVAPRRNGSAVAATAESFKNVRRDSDVFILNSSFH